NGEGIAYAMESGEMAAQVVAQALARPSSAARERALADYPRRLREEYGGYYTLGRIFVRLIGHPEVMRLCATRGLTHPFLMKVTMTLLSNLRAPRGGQAVDRLVNILAKVAPAS